MIEQLIRKFLYHPTPIPADASPPDWIGDGVEVWFDTDDDNRIHGLYWAPPPDRPTILFLHGNAQTVFEWAPVYKDLEQVECGLLLIDYPGYGKSTGTPTETSLYAAGRAAISWLSTVKQTDTESTIVFGKSLGGGVATYLADEYELRGLALESTFCSIPAMAKTLLSSSLPTSLIFPSERYESIDRISRIQVPVLVIHGAADRLIPASQARTLFAQANQPKQLYIVPSADHNDVAMAAGTAYGARIRAWVDGHEC